MEAPKNTYVRVACRIPQESFVIFNGLRLILVHSGLVQMTFTSPKILGSSLLQMLTVQGGKLGIQSGKLLLMKPCLEYSRILNI